MIKHWLYKCEGTDADGQSWSVEASVLSEFINAFDVAMEDTFRHLTEGRAVFGNPGKGCRGPYDIKRMVIEQENKSEA